MTRSPGFVSILGCVLTIEGGLPYRVDYRVRCDPDWTTSAVSIQTIRGPTRSRLELARIEPGVWMADGRRIPGIEGLVDVDLAITPATNTLPIRRLELPVGASADVDAVWVRFPQLSIERLSQRYTRVGSGRYRYASAGGSFVADLEVDGEGVVVRYGDLWTRLAPT